MRQATYIKISILSAIYGLFLPILSASQEHYQGHSSKALVQVRSAEIELAKGKADSLQKGLKILESVISDVSFKRLSLEMQMPIFLKLAHFYELNKSYLAEEKLLLSLIETAHFEPFLIQLKVKLATSFILQNRLQEAESHLKKLLKIPPKTLPQQDRDEIASLIFRLSNHYDQLLQMAENAYEKKLYNESACFYTLLLHAVKHNHFPRQSSKQMKDAYLAKIRLRLGASAFHQGDYKHASTILTAQNYSIHAKNLQDILQTSLLYLALSLKKQGAYEACHFAFCDYLAQASEQHKLPFSDFALLGAASSAYQLQNLAQSLLYIDELLRSTKNKNVELLAKLLSAKIQLRLKNYKQAHSLLEELEKYGSTRRQALYLKGLASANQQDLEMAVIHLEKSIPEAIGQNLWAKEALYALGSTYNHLAIDYSFKNERGGHKAYLERSEACFLKILAEEKNERAILGLAQNYFVLGFFFSDRQKIEQLTPLLEENKPLLSLDGQLECALLQAQIESSYHDRQKQFQKCTSTQFTPCKFFAKAHFLKALNEIQQARTEKNDPTSLFGEALATLKKAELLGYDSLQIAKVLLSFPAPNGYREACTLLESLPDDNQQEEIQYLLIQCYTALDFEKAVTKAAHFFAEFPKSPHRAELSHALAERLIAKNALRDASKLLLSVLKDFPHYPEKAHVLYLAAYAQDVLQTDIEKARALRKELCHAFPNSPYAAESYFRLFAEQEYQLATPHAIFHLESMLTLYPMSPYTIAANFYVGNFYKQESLKQKEKKIELAKEANIKFQKVDTLYETLLSKNLLDLSLKSYFFQIQVDALLSQGSLASQLLLDQKIAEKALLKLNTLLERYLVQPSTQEIQPAHSRLIKAYQEASYLLACTYEKQLKESLARKQLESLIHWHSKRGLKGRFLTSAYLDLAKQEQKMGQFSQALTFFEEAETETEYGLTRQPQKEMQKEMIKEQLLEIKIAKSECYRLMNRLDLAMTLLSEVINDDAASSLRIKAMLLRAEIYEMQHRNDLAIKQLEAASVKGGEWGLKAKTKLEQILN